MSESIPVSGKMGPHPVSTFAQGVFEKIAEARTDGYLSGYAVGYGDARRTLIPYAGGLLCLGMVFGGIAVVMFLRLSA